MLWQERLCAFASGAAAEWQGPGAQLERATASAAMGRSPLSGVGYQTTTRPLGSGDITVQPLSISGRSLSVDWMICSIRFGARDRLTLNLLAPDCLLFTE